MPRSPTINDQSEQTFRPNPAGTRELEGMRSTQVVAPRNAGAATEELDALVRGAQRGEIEAFERIYRRFSARVHLLCLRFAGDAGRAEELTQDVFVRLWQKIGTFRWESAFETWLHRTVVNLALSGIRADRRRATWELLTDEFASVAKPSRQPHPGRVLDLERAIAALPEGARTVFLLHDVEGYQHREIAKLMGLADGTCKAQLHRARRLLREALGR